MLYRVAGSAKPQPSTAQSCLGVPAAAFAGIMALGVADAAASAIGIRYGRHPICRGMSVHNLPSEPH